MKLHEIQDWLATDDPRRLDELWRLADEVRRRNVGDAVHLRGLVEISNHCRRGCLYCGLRHANHGLQRYRMSREEILACAEQAVRFGYGTVVLQAGEDDALTRDFVTGVIADIKARTPLAVTLSLGERDDEDFVAWRDAGADRYLLRFETSDRKLYGRVHPPRPGVPSDRFAILLRLRELGYEIGSGVMVGLPGQTYATLARDLQRMGELDLDMIGIGPYIPHPHTPLGKHLAPGEHTGGNHEAPTAPLREGTPAAQVAADVQTTCKAVALARLVCPRANIPATTALATLDPAAGRELGLTRGANVVMPNLTPLHYRQMYEIYPGKACVGETAEACAGCLAGRIAAIGRSVGTGRGDARRRAAGVSPAARSVTSAPVLAREA